MGLEESKAAIMSKLGPLRDAINDIENAESQISFMTATAKLMAAMLKIKAQDDPEAAKLEAAMERIKQGPPE